jgi:enamine deaminase RidA (YjgF/YER057c/UK114 family)
MSHTAPHVHHINPESLGHPIAPYSNISRARTSDVMFIAGQVGMDRDGRIPADFETQCALVFGNIGAALASQGATFANVVSFTSYLVNAADIPKFADYRTREFPNLFHGGGYPTNTLLVINRLVRAELLLEVSAVAAL